MSDVRNYLLTVDSDKDGAAEIARGTARKLEARDSTLIDVVQSLGEYIKDEDATIRSKTIQYLSSVISAVPPTFLTRQQTEVLCQFLCACVEDGGAVGGLDKLQSLHRFSKEMAILTFRAMLEHFQDLQLRPQSQRLQILQLLNDLMSNHRGALKSLGEESLVGITDLVSGEKDPRNLMIIFSVLKVVMIEWNITSHAETLFDSVFCYFPITFRPPPDDPYGITAQDLKERLRDCIAASGYFAPFSFPQLIDKLDSTSPNVKKDVLLTISACCSSYGVTTMANYSITIWDSLKYEILNVQEEDLAEEALIALQALTARLGHGLESAAPNTALAHYLKPVIKECNEYLQEPQHKQATPAGQILSGLARTSQVAFALIVKAALPPLLTLYQAADGIAKQRALLEVVLKLLDSNFSLYGVLDRNLYVGIENPLIQFKDNLLEMFSRALMGTTKEEGSFRIVALRCLLRLCTLRRYLQDNEIGMIIQHFDEIVLAENESARDDLKNEAIQALVEISRIKPHLIMDISFPAFLARLPDSSPPSDRDYKTTLEGLARLSVEKELSDTLIRRLLNRLEVVLGQGGPVDYPQAILSTLYYVLNQRDLIQDLNLSNYYEKIVVGLVSQTALASMGLRPKTALNNIPALEILGRISNLIVRSLDSHRRKTVGSQVYLLFCDAHEFPPVIFGRDASDSQRSTIILSTNLAAGIDKDAPLHFEDPGSENLSSLLDELIALSILENVQAVRLSVLQQIALMVNKFMPSGDVHLVLEKVQRPKTGLLEINNLSENRIRTVFWIAKGLILRLASADTILECLLALLPNAPHGAVAARGFGFILAPDEIISKTNGATIRLLAKQKVFNLCVPAIAKAFRNAEPSTKPNYLVALSGILTHTPHEIIMQEIDTLLPLLLQSLDLADPEVKAATISTLIIISQDSPVTVEGHISSLVNRLLKAAADPKQNTPKVRFRALRCLRVFPGKIKDSTMLPYRRAVIRGMLTVLDDPKRHVRKEAVDCRAVWLNMDEPDEDD